MRLNGERKREGEIDGSQRYIYTHIKKPRVEFFSIILSRSHHPTTTTIHSLSKRGENEREKEGKSFSSITPILYALSE